jgi:hypothetical protein
MLHKKDGKNRTDPVMHSWFVPVFMPGYVIDSTHITFGEVFSIFFMQHWGLIQPQGLCSCGVYKNIKQTIFYNAFISSGIVFLGLILYQEAAILCFSSIKNEERTIPIKVFPYIFFSPQTP